MSRIPWSLETLDGLDVLVFEVNPKSDSGSFGVNKGISYSVAAGPSNSSVIASSRIQEEPIQVFNLPGPVYEVTSGHWKPKKDALITAWYATSSAEGSIDLSVTLLIGDELLNAGGDARGTMILPSTKKVHYEQIHQGVSVYTYPLVRTDQWCAIKLSGATGHEDVVVELYGKYV